PAMLVVLPFQDWMSINGTLRRENILEERINIPSDPKHFWCYRMHLTLEELLANNEINDHILALTTLAGRNTAM
ncbi:MAG: hypothetical protein KA397_04465, partial [Paludibacteraceae bacterium]|nr:hypothetical protein [Paludibacteraceae bacterium]